jgi:hypothetical protein
MTIDEGIKLLGERFLGMNKEPIQLDDNGKNKLLSRIEVDFHSDVKSHKWSVFGHPINTDEEIQQIRVIKKRSNDSVYYLISLDNEIDFVDLISHAMTIVNVNNEMEKKMILMQEKMNELGILFNDLAYNELKTLKFNYKTSKKKKQQIEEKPVTENIPVENPPVENGEFIPQQPVTYQPEFLDKIKNRPKIDMTPDMVIPEDIYQHEFLEKLKQRPKIDIAPY